MILFYERYLGLFIITITIIDTVINQGSKSNGTDDR